MSERAVITGLGIVSSIGIGVDDYWRNALEGATGCRALPDFPGLPMEGYRSRVCAPIVDFDEKLEGSAAARLGRYAQFLTVAAREALASASLELDEERGRRCGLMIGAGMGGMMIGETELAKLYERNRPGRVHPNIIPTMTLNSAGGALAIDLGAKGPNLTTSTACSSSAHSLGQALDLIRNGRADIVIVGGADASITPLVFAGFASMRAMSTGFNDRPEKSSRPFDAERDGFVMGEGAAVLIVESRAHAQARGAQIRAEVLGYGSACEANHMVIPKEDGTEIERTMQLAIADAGLEATAIDHVSAHATSTPAGDAAEAAALRRFFGDRVDEVAVTATKSLVGHTLGGAGAIAALTAVKSLETGLVPPIANLEEPDEVCALGGLVRTATEVAGSTAMINAFGFGGNNASLVLGRHEA